ncbi:hypothetical protein CYY_005583 [Polysphondylium violaceum]|uniref:Clu domain-containing protein n=1 Tax=Polysphondylium violaceum TaxID=133409 RepID=A0A8J4PUV0_9MYCE|nr:hypothetical protein CYY_005583 [Polysphondylium violaceum]
MDINNNNNNNNNSTTRNSSSSSNSTDKIISTTPPSVIAAAANFNIENLGTGGSAPKFNFETIKNLDINQLGERINNFKIVDNSITPTSPILVKESSNSSIKSTNSNNNIGSSIGNSNSNMNSSLNSENSTGEDSPNGRSRRFSMYVYQHPTDEQKKHISELYGYKEHNDHGYRYSHDSTLEHEESSSSDSYSTPKSYYISKSTKTVTGTSPRIPTPTPSATPSTALATTTTTTTSSSTTISPTNFSPTVSSTTTTPILTTKETNTSVVADHSNSSSNNSNSSNIDPYSSPPSPPLQYPQPSYPQTILPKNNDVKLISPPDISQIPQSYFSANINYRASGSYNFANAANNYKKSNNGQYMDDEYDESKSILQPVQPPLSTAKDWNAEFQNYVYNDKIEGYRELSKLAHDFVYTAKIYGKVIISELTLPLHLKTIKPINIGGVAGGHKYIALGILFKLALDTQGLYVGDQNAMKAAGHELKGLMSYYNCRVDGLHHPLMALIDYRGYRLVAMSLLPINSDTIVYGSSDGGISVHNTNLEFNQKMKESAKILNLKGHLVGKENPKLLHSCGDIEGHIGSDGNFYLLDFARVFPPQMKLFDNSPPSHLYELIRPELVKSNDRPLSSDSLTGWGKFDVNAVEHNYEVKEASFRLFLKVIPDLANRLTILDSSEKREIHLTQELHRVGINCRHFGLLRRKVQCKSMRKAILDEIMARTMKSEIMALFRSKMKTADTPSEEPFKEVVVSYLNSIFKYEENKDHRKVWPRSLKKSIMKKFYGTFQINDSNTKPTLFEQIKGQKFDEEAIKRYIRGSSFLDEEEFFVDSVDIQNIMKRFNQLTGVGLTTRALREITKHDGVRLVQSDVKRMKARVKAHHLVEFAEGMVLWDEAKKEKSREKIEGPFCPCPMDIGTNGNTADRITDRLFDLADEHFRSALAVSPHSAEVSGNWAMMLMERARMVRECVPSEADNYYNAAEEKVRANLVDGGTPRITLENVLMEYSEFLCIWGTQQDLELDMNEANGLRSRVFARASKKAIESIQMNPSKFSLLLQKSKVIEKLFAEATHFKQTAAIYAAVSTICNILLESYVKIPPMYYREIAEIIISNITPLELMKKDETHPVTCQPGGNGDYYPKFPNLLDMPVNNFISLSKDEKEIQQLLEEDPYSIIKAEIGCLYLRYGYASHMFGIMCSKRPHTKMASIKLISKAGAMLQRAIDIDPANKDLIVDHLKKLTSSSQFVEFYQSAISCPSVMDFAKDRLSRIAHMSLKDCPHLPVEFIESVIELSPKVKMLVLDGCKQITNSTIDLILKKLPFLETLSLANCDSVTTIISIPVLKEYLMEKEKIAQEKAHHDKPDRCQLLERVSNRNSVSLPIVSSLNGILASTSPVFSSTGSLDSLLKPFTFLQTLNLNDCTGVSDDKLLNISQMQLPLVNIYLKRCNISDVSVTHLVSNSPKLCTLELSDTKITDATINAITNSRLPIKELLLDRCKNITFNSMEKLFRTIHEIRLISLADCPFAINDSTLKTIGKHCHEIHYITLTRNTTITDSGLTSMLKHCNNITELNISQCTNITDTSINQIAHSCQKIRELRMVGLNNVTSLKSISENCSELVLLDISECHKISSDLGTLAKGCSKLAHFKLRRCFGFQDASLFSAEGDLHPMNRLTVLDWSHGNIEFNAIYSISRACKNLTSLDISNCKSLNDSAIERIATSLTNLKKLKLDGIVSITDDGIKALSDGSVYTNIEVLSLVGCRKISDVSAHHIIRFQNLRKISIGGSLMTTKGADLIASNSFELVKIHVRNCLNINPTSLQEKFPHIMIDTTQKDYNVFC